MSDLESARPFSDEEFRFVLSRLPMVCVDVIIPGEKGILLVWRDSEPAKDQWWLPGGRVLYRETLAECAVRKAREEVGFETRFDHICHTDETIFDTGRWGIPTHTVNVCALLGMADPGAEPVLDNDHTDYMWLDRIDQVPLDPCVVRCIEASGVLSA